jgi:hypothetical protein
MDKLWEGHAEALDVGQINTDATTYEEAAVKTKVTGHKKKARKFSLAGGEPYGSKEGTEIWAADDDQADYEEYYSGVNGPDWASR